MVNQSNINLCDHMFKYFLVGFAALTFVGAALAQTNPSGPVWIRVYIDQFEMDGKTYATRAELAAALRKTDRRRSIAINWIIPKDQMQQTKMDRQLNTARGAVSDAGLKPASEVANEVFQ